MDPLNQDDIKTMRDKRKNKLAHRKLKKKAVAEKQAVAAAKKKKTQAAAPNPDEQPKKKVKLGKTAAATSSRVVAKSGVRNMSVDIDGSGRRSTGP